jgi:hypothetical protein
MPVQITTDNGKPEWLPVTNSIQTKQVVLNAEADFKINEDLEYIKVDRR